MRFRDLHPNVRTRIIISFIQRVSQSMVFPFMAIYFSGHYGVETAGLLMFISVVAGLLSSFYGGYWADLAGRKKVLVRSEQVRLSALFLMAAANSPWFLSPEWTFLLFVINIISIGLSTPANEAIIIDVVTPESRKYVYSVSYWATNLALSLGTMTGAVLYKNYWFELLIGVAVSSLIIWVIIQMYITETKPPSPDQQMQKVSLRNIFGSYRQVFQDRVFMQYFLVGLLMLGVEMQLGNYISVRLAQEFGVQSLLALGTFTWQADGVQMFGILKTTNTLLVVLLAAFITRWVHQMRDHIPLTLGVILFIAGYAVLALSNQWWVLLLATVVFTLGELAYVPVHQAMLAQLVPDNARSQYVAVNKLNVRGAMMLGTLGITLGAFLPAWSMAVIYLVMGAASLMLYRILMQAKRIKG